MDRPIFLIGYMGCGKTTLGNALNRLTKIDFVDLDAYIEQRSGLSISDMFAMHGEAGFRDMERSLLHEVAERGPAIVACGGGTPCFFDNMEYMNERGVTVWLKAPDNVLLERLKAGRVNRPLIAGKNDAQLYGFIISALAERVPHYGKARYVFDSSRLENEQEIEDTSEKFIARFLTT